jgi:hypothetical protein
MARVSTSVTIPIELFKNSKVYAANRNIKFSRLVELSLKNYIKRKGD